MSPNGNCRHFLESSVCRGTIYIRDFLIWLEMVDMGCIESNGRYQVFRYQAVRESHLGNFLVWWSPLETRDTAPQLSRLIYVGICLKEKLHCSLNMLTFSLYSCSRLLRFSIVGTFWGELWENFKTDKTPVSNSIDQFETEQTIRCNSMWWLGKPEVDWMWPDGGDGCGQ